MADAKPADFSLTLYPHRSLGAFGMKIVLGAVVLSNLIVAIFFWAIHAWPVFGFLGLDVVMVFVAFAINNRRARGYEQISFEGEEVTVMRVTALGQSQRKFNRRWLKVELEYDEARELAGRLFLVSHGKRTQIASFLGIDERQALARQLQAALVRPKI
jgi:uncharacterized membrane protein